MRTAPDDLVFVDQLEIRGRVAKMAVYTLSDHADVPHATTEQPSGEQSTASSPPPPDRIGR
jgi:hypothetical protein